MGRSLGINNSVGKINGYNTADFIISTQHIATKTVAHRKAKDSEARLLALIIVGTCLFSAGEYFKTHQKVNTADTGIITQKYADNEIVPDMEQTANTKVKPRSDDITHEIEWHKNNIKDFTESITKMNDILGSRYSTENIVRNGDIIETGKEWFLTNTASTGLIGITMTYDYSLDELAVKYADWDLLLHIRESSANNGITIDSNTEKLIRICYSKVDVSDINKTIKTAYDNLKKAKPYSANIKYDTTSVIVSMLESESLVTLSLDFDKTEVELTK